MMRAKAEDLEDIDAANAAFRAEVARYRLHFGCGGCAHVCRADQSCSMGYPNTHLTREDVAIQPDGGISFCKHWELGETLGFSSNEG